MTQDMPRILDGKGQVIPPRGTREHRNYLALNGIGGTPYDAASYVNDDVALWRPGLLSADSEINPYRDTIVARVRDLVRNDGWGCGAVTRTCDNVVGANLRPIFRPDYRFLKLMTGNKAFDAVWAHEFGRAADAYYRSFANDPGKWCDIERSLTLPQLFYVAFRHELIDGDSLAVNRYEPSRVGPGRARYGTAVQLIDPDRLSNPNNRFDMRHLRGGVEIDDFGAAVGYHIREAHQNDWYNGALSLKWAYIPREDDYGRAITVHNFPQDRASQHRGGAGFLTPVLDRLKMLSKYDRTEMQAALINAMFGAFIESPYDPAMVADAMGTSVNLNAPPGGDYQQVMESGSLGSYQDMRSEFHARRRIMLGDSRIPTLFPGEKIGTINATHPNGNFGAFEGAMLRNIAAATGLTEAQITQDYSKANYSSMRAAMLEAHKTFDRRRANFTIGFCHQITTAWLEESMDLDAYPMPVGVSARDFPEFYEARHALGFARWIGPARGWVDPVAEKQGAWLGLKMGVGSLEALCAEQGEDLEEILDAQQMEIRMFEDRKMTPPDWSGAPTAVPTSIPSPPTVATKATPQGNAPPPAQDGQAAP
jgi:lambda family phage portal protein